MSTHCDLGSRYPIESCPTRIIKKSQYEMPQKLSNANQAIPGNITIAKIARSLGCSRQTLRGMAVRLFDRQQFLGGISKESAEKLMEYYHKCR